MRLGASATALESTRDAFRTLLDNELCAGFADGSIGVCSGDSGGPLVVPRGNGGWDLVGVVSRGAHNRCDSYGVFSRVTSHRAWITSMISIDTPAYGMLRSDVAVAVTAQAGFDTTPPGVQHVQRCAGLAPAVRPDRSDVARRPDQRNQHHERRARVRSRPAGHARSDGGVPQSCLRDHQNDGGQQFGDVPSSYPFYPFIEALTTAGLAVACPGGFLAFCPDAQATRGDVANMLSAFTLAGRTPPLGWAINVTAGSYGSNAGASPGNVTWHLAASCNGLSSCNYSVNYQIVGDPVPGVAKDYLAEWTCTPGGTVHRAWTRAEAGFGSIVRLVCP